MVCVTRRGHCEALGGCVRVDTPRHNDALSRCNETFQPLACQGGMPFRRLRYSARQNGAPPFRFGFNSLANPVNALWHADCY